MGSQIPPLQNWLFSYYIAPSFVEISQGQYWRLVTPMFIHFGVMHIAFNGALFWALGSAMEKVHSKIGLIIIIGVISISSNISQYLMSGPFFGGLSGVVYGLFAFAWLQHRLNPYYPIGIPDQTAKALIIWFFICLSGVLKFVGIHVANTAHFIGIVSGLSLSLLYFYVQKKHNANFYIQSCP
jgi:Uncharacterized membrane protein (homolog of Drosophila rhomboid)